MTEVYLATESGGHDVKKIQTFVRPYLDKARPRPFSPERLKLLLSYHYFKSTNVRELLETYFGNCPPKIFIDSGGFSAATQGVAISIDDYIKFLREYADVISVYANLDEIGDPELTYTRQQEMLDAGLRPIPVFHVGESMDWLERYIDEGYDYIALGGMVPYSKDKKRLVRWLTECFNIAERSERDVLFHGFGMTNWDLMRAWPWRSVDSSSWCAGFRYGRVPLFDEKLGRFYSVALRDIRGSFKYSDLIRSYGFSPNDLALEGDFDRIKIASISAIAYLKAEEWLRRKHGESLPARGVDRDPSDRRSVRRDGSVSRASQRNVQSAASARSSRDDSRLGMYAGTADQLPEATSIW